MLDFVQTNLKKSQGQLTARAAKWPVTHWTALFVREVLRLESDLCGVLGEEERSGVSERLGYRRCTLPAAASQKVAARPY